MLADAGRIDSNALALGTEMTVPGLSMRDQFHRTTAPTLPIGAQRSDAPGAFNRQPEALEFGASAAMRHRVSLTPLEGRCQDARSPWRIKTWFKPDMSPCSQLLFGD